MVVIRQPLDHGFDLEIVLPRIDLYLRVTHNLLDEDVEQLGAQLVGYPTGGLQFYRQRLAFQVEILFGVHLWKKKDKLLTSPSGY